MKEFVFGTDSQFIALDKELSKGKKYKFSTRQLPDSCTPGTANLWFAKVEDMYVICTDKGITTSSNNKEFKDFIEKGEKKFRCLRDMTEFFRSLRVLYPERKEVTHEYNSDNVVDKEKLKEIKASEKKIKNVWPEDISAPLKKKVFGQDSVLDALADMVVINQMRKNKKLLAVALVGPTATGKSETAKSLAEVMSEAYDTPFGFIEIAGSEFIGEHTVHRFFGAPPGFVGNGQPTILDPVRQNPNHVIVINEIEKADEKILVGLMEAIDTGILGMADNSQPIDLNRCILLFTSNIPIDMEKYEEASAFEQSEICRDAFTKHCGRPEISGKIGNFLVFNKLDDMATTDIIVKFVRDELDSFDLKLAHIDEHLMADFLKHQTKYGARGIRGLVSGSVGRHLLRMRKQEDFNGMTVNMKGTIDNIEFEFANLDSRKDLNR